MPLRKYERDSGEIVYVRVSAAKAAIMQTEAAGSISDTRLRIAAGGSTRRKIVLVARRALYLREDPVGTTGRISSQRLELVIPTKAGVDSVPQTVTYLGKSDWQLSDIIPED